MNTYQSYSGFVWRGLLSKKCKTDSQQKEKNIILSPDEWKVTFPDKEITGSKCPKV